MPKYIGSKKVSDAYIGGKKVSKKYRGPDLYYSAFVPAGTVLWNGNQAFIPTSNGVGQTVTLSQPISKSENGLVVNFSGLTDNISSPNGALPWGTGLSAASTKVPKNWTGKFKVVSGTGMDSNCNVFIEKIDDTHIKFSSDQPYDTSSVPYLRGGEYSTFAGWGSNYGTYFVQVKDITTY